MARMPTGSRLLALPGALRAARAPAFTRTTAFTEACAWASHFFLPEAVLLGRKPGIEGRFGQHGGQNVGRLAVGDVHADAQLGHLVRHVALGEHAAAPKLRALRRDERLEARVGRRDFAG